MKSIVTIIALCMLTSGSFTAQDEEKAKIILDGLSKEMATFKTIYIEFNSKIKSEGVNSASSGKAWIKGNKYYYEDNNAQIWNDGEYLWNLELDEGVCYKSDADDEDGINPSKLLTIWEDGFKYQYYDKGSTEAIHAIKLFPKEPKESKYHTLIVKVNKAANAIHSMTVKTKDGISLYYSIEKMSSNLEISDSKFMFDNAKHPGIEIEEL